MKKFILFICVSTMIIASLSLIFTSASDTTVDIWDGVVPAPDKDYAFEGKGTESEPWLIKSAAELAIFAANVRLNDKDTCYFGKYFKLTVDIDMDNKKWWGIGGFRTITNYTKSETTGIGYEYFAGSFDGDRHVIKNLKIESKNNMNQQLHGLGLFGYVSGASIKNIGIESGEVDIGGSNTGAALIGIARYGVVVHNCFNKANIVANSASSYTWIGGLIGYAEGRSIDNPDINYGNVVTKKQIFDCYNTGNITFTNNDKQFRVGGIIANTNGTSYEFINIYNVGTISINNTGTDAGAAQQVGGIAGSATDYVYSEDVFSDTKIILSGPTSTVVAGFVYGNVSATITFSGHPGTVSYVKTPDSAAVRGVGREDVADFASFVVVDSVAIPFAADSQFIVAEGANNEETTTEQSTTTTKAADVSTTPKNTTTTTKDESTTASQDKSEKGCKSSVSVAFLLMSAGFVTLFTLIRKKKTQA